MKKHFYTLLLAGLCSIAMAEEIIAKNNMFIFGNLKPQQATEDSLRFKAELKDASSAQLLKPSIDPAKGVRVEFDFKVDAQQTNVFPRLLEIHKFSIMLSQPPKEYQPEDPVVIKILISGENEKQFAQIKMVFPFKPDEWNRCTAWFSAADNSFGMRINDKEEFGKINFPIPEKLSRMLLGANALNGSPRGFSGEIAKLKITAPYNVPAQAKAETGRRIPMEYRAICAIKGRHLAFPGVARMPNNDLAVVFREGEKHLCAYGRICMVFSKDNGLNWSAPKTIADSVTDERDPGITVCENRVLVSYTAWNSFAAYPEHRKNYQGATNYIEQAGAARFGGTFWMFSGDNGENWEKPVKVPVFCPHGPFYYEGKIYSPKLLSDRVNNKRLAEFWKADTSASNFEKIAEIATSGLGNEEGTVVLGEPYTAALADGTFVTVFRVAMDGFMRISFSSDQGKTWSEPKKTEVRGYPQHLLALRDGRLLASYGYRFYPYGIRACLSNDGGKTWDMQNEIIIRDGGTSDDLGYPTSIELEHGKILTVYYYNSQERPDPYIEGAIYTL